MLILYYPKPYDQELGAGSVPDLRNLGQIGVRTAGAKELVPEMTRLNRLTSRWSAIGGRDPERGSYFVTLLPQLRIIANNMLTDSIAAVVYYGYFTDSDFEGSALGVVKVSVPCDKNGDFAIDGGELYDSTR